LKLQEYEIKNMGSIKKLLGDLTLKRLLKVKHFYHMSFSKPCNLCLKNF